MSIEPKYYEINEDQVLKKLDTNKDGLDLSEVRKRQEKYGFNILPAEKPDSYFLIFLKQFKNPLIYALIVIALVTFFIKEYTDSIIIFTVLFFNAIIGVYQEGRAQRTIMALHKLTNSTCLVKRNGQDFVIGAEELVPGDIVYVREGDKIVADIRLLEANNLLVNEAALTGESQSVAKTSKKISGSNLLISEQVNMIFAGTFVNTGRSVGVVVKTGSQTEIGKIANLIQKGDAEIPLQASLRKLTNNIIIGVFIFSVIFYFVGILTGIESREMFLRVSSLLVAIIPEGLPVILTLVLAQGVKRMAEKNVLVKKLQAVEALGQAQIIAVDKTGTITKNELTVTKIIIGNIVYKVTGDGYEPVGKITNEAGEVATRFNNKSLEIFSEMGTLSANAKIFRPENETTKIVGDPTEAAMLVFGEKVGFDKAKLIEVNPIIDDIPFSYHTKYYANLHLDKKSDTKTMIVTGAPEVLIEKSSEWLNKNGEPEKLKDEDLDVLEQIIKENTAEGLRVIALAFKKIPKNSNHITNQDIDNLCLLGLYAMEDGLRTEVKDSVKKAKEAGMKIIMITGDRKETAYNIAKEAGIISNENEKILTGPEIDKFDDLALKNSVLETTVFARVTPEHKLRIIKAYQDNNKIIAMTGDGVNDVPSLANANLGVSMGKIGTEVAQEASDIVLLDDNFGNIPDAVEEGRHIYLSIKKALLYLFATNIAEMLLVVVAFVAGLPTPFEPAQIIWLNLITDSFMVLPLALEPRDKDVMRKSFKQSKFLIDKKMFLRMMFLSSIMTILCFIIFSRYLNTDTMYARSMILTTIVVCQFITAWTIRSGNKTIWEKSPFKNKWLIIASISIIALQFLAEHTPFFQKILETVALRPIDWGIAFMVGFIYLGIDQARILVFRLVNKVDLQ